MENQNFSAAASNKTTFHTAYLAVLRAVIACEEERSGPLINKMVNFLKPSADDSTEIAAIKTELDTTYINDKGRPYKPYYHLYGDFKSNGSAPWIKNPQTIAMIGRHIAVLGLDTDKDAFNRFAQKTADAFRQPYAAMGLKIA